MTWFSEELGSNEGLLLLLLLLLGFTCSKGMPLLLPCLRYPAPVQMSGVLPEVNTHRVFSLFKCWVIIDLTPTLMLEKVGSGVVEDKVWELEKGLLLPIQGRKSKSPPSPYFFLSHLFSTPVFRLCCHQTPHSHPTSHLSHYCSYVSVAF